jgi:hypothetical protein
MPGGERARTARIVELACGTQSLDECVECLLLGPHLSHTLDTPPQSSGTPEQMPCVGSRVGTGAP